MVTENKENKIITLNRLILIKIPSIYFMLKFQQIESEANVFVLPYFFHLLIKVEKFMTKPRVNEKI